MLKLENNIYKIITIMNINDASNPDDMKIIGFGIIWSCILLIKLYE